jgi:hypothetical protein
MTYRSYQQTRRSAVGVLAAVFAVTATLVGCAGGSALNGHPAPTLSGSALESASRSASSSGSAGAAPGSQSRHGTTTPGTQPRQATTRPGIQSQSASTQPSRPYRPTSVVLGLFQTSAGVPCTTVAGGSSDTVFTIERFVKRLLCFTGLDASAPPNIIVTTPEGTRETMALSTQNLQAGTWEFLILPLPGQGAEANLGEYTFQVTTAISGSGSASPTTGVMTTSGRFTVIPARQPGADVGTASMADPKEVFLPLSSRLRIWFSGYPAFSMVYVSLYGPGATQGYPLLADLPALSLDRNGEGELIWVIPSGAVMGRYAIWIDPPPTGRTNLCMAFDIKP